MQRSMSILKKSQLATLSSSRTITDIPWYKRTDGTHLHIVDSRSTRRKFDIKMEKLERERVAADKRRHSTKVPLNPSELKPIELPKFIERGPSDVLRAIAGCLKRDFTGPDYQFHDDPYLIPYNSLQKRDFVMSKQGGKRAARFVFAQHPELFDSNLIEMVPKIKAFTPKTKVTEKNASVELLQSLIEACNVVDAIQTYAILKQKNVKVDGNIKLAYLEMLCFHNSENEEMPFDYLESYDIVDVNQANWEKGGAADHLASEMIESGEHAHEARLALMLGKAKFNDHFGVLRIYDEIKAYNGPMDTLAFNAILRAKAKGNCDDWNEVKQVLETMNAEKVRPDRTTLENVLAFLSKLSANKMDMTTLTLSVLAEFNSIGIKPSLAAYISVVKIFSMTSKKLILKDIVRELATIQKAKGTLLYEMNGEDCYQFFRDCMMNCGSMPDFAHQVNDLVMADPNYELLLGGYKNKQRYLRAYLRILLAHEPLEDTMELVNLFTPHFWNPMLDFYAAVLKAIETNFAPQFLPKLWTDMIENKFCSARRLFQIEFIANFGQAILSLGSKEDPVLEKTFAKIAEDMLRLLPGKYAIQPRDMAHDAKVCNNVVRIGLLFGNRKVAEEAVQFCKDQVSVMPDNLESRVLEQFVTAMIDANEVDEAYKAIIFTHELGFKETAERSASAASALALDQAQKRTLNNLFSSNSKWVML